MEGGREQGGGDKRGLTHVPMKKSIVVTEHGIRRVRPCRAILG